MSMNIGTTTSNDLDIRVSIEGKSIAVYTFTGQQLIHRDFLNLRNPEIVAALKQIGWTPPAEEVK